MCFFLNNTYPIDKTLTDKLIYKDKWIKYYYIGLHIERIYTHVHLWITS